MSAPQPRTRRRLGWALLFALVVACTLLGGTPVGAQETSTTTAPAEGEGSTTTTAPEGEEPAEDEATGRESVRGELLDKRGTRERDDDEPVPDVEIAVLDLQDEEIGTATSDEEGRWEVPVPGPGRYRVVLDTDTLPDGLSLDEGKEALELQVNPGQARVSNFILGGRAREAASTFDRFLQLGFTGIRFGLIIGITSVGLSLIFGTTGLTNFAHGEMVTFGGIIAWYMNVSAGIHMIPATLLSVLAGAALAGLLELGIWRRLRSRGVSLLAMMVVSIGLSIVLRYGFQLFFGASPRVYADYQQQESIIVGPVSMAPRDLWTIALIIIVLILVALVLQRTRMGKAIRAVADNRDLAASSGIDVDRVILYVWAVGGSLAALGGVLFALNERISFNSGFALLLLMFAGITLGGLGTAYGALLGSFIVGLFIQVSTLWVSAELKNVGALVVLILVLLVRPQGILGRAERIG